MQQSYQLPGSTIEDIVNNVVPSRIKGAGIAVIAMIEGEAIDPALWAQIKPKQGTIVNIRVLPQGGGGGKNPISALLSIAVLVAAPYLAPIVGGAVGITSSIGVQLIGAGIGALGRLAVSALAPPPTQSNSGVDRVNNQTESPTQFIEGASNAIDPYGVIPVNLGTNRIFPKQAARPYTETQDNDQYVRQLFSWGYGPEVILDDLQIGETLLSEFTDYEIEHRLNADLHLGTDLYTQDVFQEDMSILLNQVDGYTTRTTQLDVDEAVIDITFASGLASYNAEGKRQSKRVELELQYAKTGESPQDWSTGAAVYKDYDAQVITIPEAGTRSYGGQIRGGTRTDIISINKFSGAIQRLEYVPSSNIRIATVNVTTDRDSGTGLVTTDITVIDSRQSSLFGTQLEDLNSFIPTKASSTSVNITAGAVLVNELSILGNQKEALRRSVRVVFPENDQYDIRIRRITTDTNSDQIFDKAYLSAIKSVKYQLPVNLTDQNGTAVRIKATDQLNGSLDQFNALCSTVIPDYDPALDAWVDRVTDNPASIYRYVLQGAANAKALADSKINIDDFEDWHQHCAEQGYSYNRVIDYETTVDAVLRDVASAGAATPAIVDGKRTIAIDRVKSDIVQVITPRNSSNYNGEMIYPELPHAFRVQFRNQEKGYAQDERVVFDDGYDENNATIYEVLEVLSCTNPDLAFKIGRRHIAAARLRPESHTFNMDFEHLVALKGNRIKLEHDAPLVGIGDGRIKTVTNDGNSPALVTGFTLDDTVEIPSSSKTYYVRIRLADGTQIYKELDTSAGPTQSFIFKNPFDILDTPAAGDLCYFTEVGGELDLIITRIDSEDELGAKITAINYAPEIFVAESTAIPPFDSKVTTPLALLRPEPPILLDEQSNESVMLLNSDGSYTPRAVFTLQNNNEGVIFTQVKLRVSGTDDFTNADVLESTPERLVITGLEDNKKYDIHIRYRRSNSNVISEALQLNNYLFIGASGKPKDPTGFKINVDDNTAFFKWDAGDDIDHAYTTMRFSGVFTGATWGTSQIVEEKIYDNRLEIPFIPGTYLIKHVDRTANESDNATAIITYDPGVVSNAITTVTENPEFLGLKDNVVGLPNSITHGDTDSDGYYYFNKIVDLTAVFPAFVSATIIANGAYINNLFDMDDLFTEDDIFGVGQNDIFGMDDIFGVEDIFGIGNDAWAVGLEYATIDSDPLLTDPNNNLAETDVSAWADTRGVITQNDALSPIGALDAHTFTEDTATGQHYARPEQDMALDNEYTFSVFLKSSNRWARLLLRDDDNTSHYIWVNINLQTGEILGQLAAGNASLTSASIEPYGNDWYRLIVKGTVNSAGGTRLQSYIYPLVPDGSTGDITYTGDGVSTIEMYGLEVVSATEAYEPTYSSWQELEASTIEFRAIKFRLKMQSLEAGIGAEVTELSVKVDMPDRIERGEDMAVPIAGKTVNFSPNFKETPAVAITIQDGDVDDKIEFTSKSAGGFTFKVYNGTAAAYVERTFDYIASGYGRENT